jgi:hypothetical protein
MTLQKIRALQALQEINVVADVSIKHSENPITYIGNKSYTLIFPRFLLNHFSTQKEKDYVFIGLIKEKRKQFLSAFPTAYIKNSKRGRNIQTKEYDIDYFNIMSNYKFTLCPNGDFVWTYRFFEAILCGSIPIIEQECNLYDGFKFYTKKETHIYDLDIVHHNLNKLKNEMML